MRYPSLVSNLPDTQSTAIHCTLPGSSRLTVAAPSQRRRHDASGISDFVISINNNANPASLILGKVYRRLPDAEAETHDMLRIVDEDTSEPDGYLYPAASGRGRENVLIFGLATTSATGICGLAPAYAHEVTPLGA